MTELVPRRFANDGGPLLVVAEDVVRVWEGTQLPSGGRVVAAAFRWNEPDLPACDYDLACDVNELAAVIDVFGSWALVFGEAQSAVWLTGASEREFHAVGIEHLDDERPELLRELAAEPVAWRELRARVRVGPAGLLLAHAGGVLAETNELPAFGAADTDVRPAAIGDGLRHRVPAGDYRVSMRHAVRAELASVTLVRFARV